MGLSFNLHYRNHLMGFSSLYIVFHHSRIAGKLQPPLIDYCAALGYMFVDIFVLCSGFGCYYSLSNNPDVWDFLKKRIHRTLPSFYLFLIIYSAFFFQKMSWLALYNNIFCVESQRYSVNWYLSAIWVYYFLAPLTVVVVDKMKSFRQIIVTFFFLFCYSICYWGTFLELLIAARFMIFLLGVYIGKWAKEKLLISPSICMIMFAVMIVGLPLCSYLGFYEIFDKGQMFYGAFLAAPGVSIGLMNLFALLGYSRYLKWIVESFNLAGDYCFEIYLSQFLYLRLIKDGKNLFLQDVIPFPILFFFHVFPSAFLLKRGTFYAEKVGAPLVSYLSMIIMENNSTETSEEPLEYISNSSRSLNANPQEV